MFTEYPQYDAMGLHELIQKKEVSIPEVLEAAISQIETYNPQINALVYKQFDEARSIVSQRDLTSLPLGGVPFLLKDLLGEQKGHPSTSSCPPLSTWKAPENSELVNRFENAGLCILGRCNTPQLGIYGVTEPDWRGPTRNPWNLEHTPGGSSGGSAAAVAARMVPIAHGGDGGGSIRIPASHCGLVGLKASRGRLPTGPYRGERWNGFVVEGIMSRSVRDTALLLDLTAGNDVGVSYSGPPSDSWLSTLDDAPQKLRIAFTRTPLFGKDLHPDNEKALMHTVQLLENMGHLVEEACPTYDKTGLTRAYYAVVSTGVALGIAQMEEKLGRKIALSELELSTWALQTISKSMSAPEYMGHVDLIQSQTRKVGQFFEQYDVLLTPTAAKPPVAIGQFKLSSSQKAQIHFLRRFPAKNLVNKALDALAGDAISATPNTMLFNQTGQPAISVPLYWNAQNLPIGSQLVGRFGDEKTLLQLARQLEIAQPWGDKMPALIQ